AGDEAGSWAVLEAAMSSGMSPQDLYLDVLVPALHSVGHRWSTGELSVADEHRASGVTLRVIGRLGPRFARRGRKRGTIVLATPPGDTHGLPVALMGDLLRARGFDVADLGADVPSDSLAATAQTTTRLVAVGLCATVAGNETNLGRSIEAVRAVTDVPVILGGGAMLGRQTSVLALGADQGGLSTSEALDAFEQLSVVRV
ncbi:MAG TPA: B12-binding domain-containing protein, partial [Acidimicrobiales bacterium]